MSQPHPAWVASLRERLDQVNASGNGFPVSIKLRVNSGCFCRSCCPHAWRQIDEALPRHHHRNGEFIFEEHESGPEIMVYLAVTTAGLALAKSVVDLITTIIKARSEGAKNGDRQREPIELIVRHVRNGDEFQEEVVMRIDNDDRATKKRVNDEVVKALEKLAEDARQ